MFKKILMPIDLQETQLATKAVRIAIDEARKHSADIYVMTVMPGFGMPLVSAFFPDDAMEKAKREVGAELKRYSVENFPSDLRTHLILADGHPAERILAEAEAIQADLIIIPSHAKSLSQMFLGSCAARVVEHAHCSVMVVKQP